MRRRCQIVMLVFLVAACAGEGPAPRRLPVDWLLVFWLPYDNDLAVVAPDVLGALERARGPAVGKVDVVAQVDAPGDEGMARLELANGRRRVTRLGGRDDSASASELADLLDWAVARHPARRIAIAILGHSGRLEELSPDARGDDALAWMATDDLASVLEDFRARAPGEVELLFLQTCAKASVEAVYALRHAARFLLVSQAPLGAPNHYYGGAMAALRAVPDMDGEALANVIASSERPDMFVGLSLVDAAALDALPPLALAAVREAPGALPSRALATRVFVTNGEALVDAQALLSARRARAPGTTTALDALAAFLARDVLVWHRESAAPSPDATVLLPREGTLTGLWVRLEPVGSESLLGELVAIDP